MKPEQKEKKDNESKTGLASILEGGGSESPSRRSTRPRPKLDPQTSKKLGASEQAAATPAPEDSASESAEDSASGIKILRTLPSPDDKGPAPLVQKARPILQRQEKKMSIQKIKPNRRTGLAPGQRQLPRPRPLDLARPPNFSQISDDSGNTTETLDDELFNFNAIETLLDPTADDAEIQAILKGSEEEHKEPAPNDPGDLNKLSAELDDLKKYVNLELRQPKKRTEHSKPSNVASQMLAPGTSKKMAETVRALIEGSEGDRPKSLRVLNILLCAAGGTTLGNVSMICVPIMYPETDECAKRLLATPAANRYEYLKALFDQLSRHLPPGQDQLVRSSLADLYSATNVAKNPELVDDALFALRRRLEAQLSNV